MELQYDNIRYVLNNDNTYTVTGVINRNTAMVIIPKSINRRMVTQIDDYAFAGYRCIKSIHLPRSIRNIGVGAFKECTNLAQLYVPDGVEIINDYTFYDCNRLTKVRIPNTIKRIGYGAFGMCNSLVQIIIPDGVDYIEDFTFSCCHNLSSVRLPDSVINIGASAFINCESLCNINIPQNLNYIGDYAFFNCSKLQLSLPFRYIDRGRNIVT